MNKEKIIIDCDPGMDDSLAIILAVKSELFDIQAITTVAGNYPVDLTCINARKSLELIGRPDIPVAKGMARPLVRNLPPDPFTHGKDGQAEYYLPDPLVELHPKHAVELIIDVVREHPGEIRIVTLAPLTNIAAAFRLAPDLPEKVKKITALAGTFGLNRYSSINATGGNAMSEWNVFVDPEAADIVFRSGVGIDAVGLDLATHYDLHCIDGRMTELSRSGKQEADFVRHMVDYVIEIGWLPYCVLIDSMAVAAAADPSIVSFRECRVGVETKGELTLGMTVIDDKHYSDGSSLPLIRVGYDADYKRFVDWAVDLVIA